MKADATAENKPAYLTPESQINITTEVDKKLETHEDQGGVQVFVVLLDKVAVILVGFALELVVELDPGTTGRSKEVRKEARQRF